jgi:peptide/nickel transport system permease protein
VDRPVISNATSPKEEPEPARSRHRGRLISYAATLVFLLTLNFLLPRAMPGDPISSMLGSTSSGAVVDDEAKRSLTRYYGLDRSLWAQYAGYLGGLARGDLGTSIRYNVPVSELLIQRLPWTLLLAITAVALGTLIGLVGIHSGWRRGRGVDRGLLSVFLTVRNVPPFFLGPLAIFFFGVKLGWVPLDGGSTPFSSFGLLRRAGDIAHHLVLPASVLALQIGAFNYLVLRAGMVGELGSDYLVAGKAKGLSQRRLKYRYAARNALAPFATATGLQLGFAITVGPLFLEPMFAYPGIGQVLFEAVASRDYPTLQGCFLVFSLIVVTLNFLTDVVNTRLDPRTSA